MSNQFRIDSVMPRRLQEELLRLYRLDRRWITVYRNDADGYSARPKYPSWAVDDVPNAPTLMGCYALSHWLGDGPKVFKLTAQQQEALSQVDLSLPVSEFTSPYPAICVQTDVPPFYGVVVYWHEDECGIVCNALSKDTRDDVCTTIYRAAPRIEDSITRYDDDCQDTAAQCHKALRIALNACLALSHFGHHRAYLFPHEAANDRWLASQTTPKGEREAKAKARLAVAPELLTFEQDVKLHSEAGVAASCPGEPTGREVRSHWRRGHWRRQNFGKDLMETKRIFIRPVLVRADRFTGEPSNTAVTYRV